MREMGKYSCIRRDPENTLVWTATTGLKKEEEENSRKCHNGPELQEMHHPLSTLTNGTQVTKCVRKLF